MYSVGCWPCVGRNVCGQCNIVLHARCSHMHIICTVRNTIGNPSKQATKQMCTVGWIHFIFLISPYKVSAQMHRHIFATPNANQTGKILLFKQQTQQQQLNANCNWRTKKNTRQLRICVLFLFTSTNGIAVYSLFMHIRRKIKRYQIDVSYSDPSVHAYSKRIHEKSSMYSQDFVVPFFDSQPDFMGSEACARTSCWNIESECVYVHEHKIVAVLLKWEEATLYCLRYYRQYQMHAMIFPSVCVWMYACVNAAVGRKFHVFCESYSM